MDTHGVIEHIKVVRPVNVNLNTFFAIEYKDDPFIIETPYIYVKYRPTIFENGYYKLDLEMSNDLIKYIKDIETYIVMKLSKKYKRYTESFSYSGNILRTRSMSYKSIEFFDKQGVPIDGSKMCVGDRVSLLIYIDKYIYNTYKSYINYQLLQVKTFKMISIKNIEQNLDIEKYRKMLKIGVPLCGVKQKMMMDGINNESIEKISRILSSQQTGPPPPPPPPPRIPFPAKGSGDMSAVFGDIRNGNFKLKKFNRNCDFQSSKVLKCVDTSRKVPSLAEIQNALKNLRRIN